MMTPVRPLDPATKTTLQTPTPPHVNGSFVFSMLQQPS
jgi:hypothetical protein